MDFPVLGLITAALMIAACITHLVFKGFVRHKPVVCYTAGVLGVLAVCWLGVLASGLRDARFFLGMAYVSLAFIPFGAVVALMHYGWAVEEIATQRKKREEAERAARAWRAYIDGQADEQERQVSEQEHQASEQEHQVYEHGS